MSNGDTKPKHGHSDGGLLLLGVLTVGIVVALGIAAHMQQRGLPAQDLRRPDKFFEEVQQKQEASRKAKRIALQALSGQPVSLVNIRLLLPPNFAGPLMVIHDPEQGLEGFTNTSRDPELGFKYKVPTDGVLRVRSIRLFSGSNLTVADDQGKLLPSFGYREHPESVGLRSSHLNQFRTVNGRPESFFIYYVGTFAEADSYMSSNQFRW